MREPIRDKGRLEHIIHYSENVEEMTQGITFDDFNNDKILYFAVMKNIEIVGEAAYMLSKEFIIMHPELPWQQIIGMRHLCLHLSLYGQSNGGDYLPSSFCHSSLPYRHNCAPALYSAGANLY